MRYQNESVDEEPSCTMKQDTPLHNTSQFCCSSVALTERWAILVATHTKDGLTKYCIDLTCCHEALLQQEDVVDLALKQGRPLAAYSTMYHPINAGSANGLGMGLALC
jgi:hypothetical protein